MCFLVNDTKIIIKMNRYLISLLAISIIGFLHAHGRELNNDHLRLPSEKHDFFDEGKDDSVGTRWAVLIAGSNGYWNYRHQADVCHAYQILKNGGVKEENIVVFMYDDIAYNWENPRQGVIINSPDGDDVYHGVPKDYTGNEVNVDNFFAVLLGDKSKVKGGSGKVVDSGPDDRIFVYYTDHGGPGVLGMPTYPYLYADDLNKVLKQKHDAGTYKSLVFYLEACEAGSIFEGLLPQGLNIYATTASDPYESSWGTYCPGDYPSPPLEYDTCLGDLYSVAWMEDCDVHNLRTETVRQQYKLVKERTSSENLYYGSHVMEYGDMPLSKDHLHLYMGTNPANDNFTFTDENSLSPSPKAVNQRDADLLHFWHKYRKAPEGSERKAEAQKQFSEVMSHRMHIDNSIELISKVLFGLEKGPRVLKTARTAGKPLVDDWTCLKTLVRTFETHCGSLSQYGMKHMREINDIDRARLQNKEDVNVHENKPDSFPNFLDGNNNAWVSTSERACTSPHCTDSPGVMVEELTIRNLNSGKSEIVGASNPCVRDDSDSLSFSEFLDKKQEDRNKNETADNSSLEEKQLSSGGIRTKILSKSGFSEYFVKNTLKGKGVVLRGPAQDGVGVHIRGQSDSRDLPIPEPRPSVSPDIEGISLREWLNGGRNKVDKSRSLYIFKQILDLVDSSHSQGVALQALRPSCFRLLPSNNVLYLGSPAQKEVPDIHHLDNQDGKKRKYGENWKSFGRWPQFPNRSVYVHGTSHSVKPHTGGPRASGHGFNQENVVSGGNLLEEQWYASPEELRERGSTLSSNIYALGVLLFELLGSFESTREHAVAMMHLRQRILPPSFLSENPKEAGYCLWLLHPEALARPSTRDILKSKLVSEIEEISTDKLLAFIAEEDMDSDLLLHFLESLKEHKQKCATKLVKDINCIESDLTEIESRRSNNITFDTNNTISPLSTIIKSNLIKSNLDHLESAYFLVRSSIEVPVSDATGFPDHKVLTSRESYKGTQNVEAEKEPVDRLGIFFNGLCKYARFSTFEVRGNLRSGDFSSAANVICSLGFDRDEDYFATAGVSKKIKVYDYHLLLDDSVDIHYPAVEMPNKSKLTCICWNSYINNYLASTDYDGIVKLWDVGSGQTVSHHIEHERRAWSVDFSKVDPTKLASGSDDCSVKLWSINEKNCLSTIRTIANVCCVQFSPYSAHLLSFGSSDYRTYCYDMRNISTPLCILAGHDRAVSYVKFLDSETIVSASTDNTLKLWDLKKASFGCLSTNACVLTYKGHANEKNFVGLSVADGYIACGSETNEVFAYYRSLPMPITSHKFGSIDPVSGKETDHANNQFVSSVCWRQKSDMVIAANSSGCLKLLQMV